MSMRDAVATLDESISKMFNDENRCVGVFLDQAKAFVTVLAKILFENRGLQSYNIPSRSRKIRVISWKLSDSTDVDYGVPRGSILGPILFLICIHKTSRWSNSHLCWWFSYCICSLYLGIGGKANQERNEENEWLKNNLLTPNTSKTKYICI